MTWDGFEPLSDYELRDLELDLRDELFYHGRNSAVPVDQESKSKFMGRLIATVYDLRGKLESP